MLANLLSDQLIRIAQEHGFDAVRVTEGARVGVSVAIPYVGRDGVLGLDWETAWTVSDLRNVLGY